MSWRQSVLDGGGYLSTIAVDPSGSGFVIAGGDVAGLHLSENLGQRWQARNLGRTDTKQLKVATIKWSQTVVGKVYAGIGAQGSGGGLYVSTDYGRTWTLQSAVPQWSGGNTKTTPGLPVPHPRSTGNLLELDESGGYLHAGTFDQGLMRSNDDGVNWTTIGLGGGTNYCRGMALDPADPTTLYVCIYQAASPAVYKITNARDPTPTVTLLANSPNQIEELIVLDGVIYAAGTGGIYSKTTASGDIVWTVLDSSINQATITGHVQGGNTILYTGSYKALLIGSVYSNYKKSVDGGANWIELTTDPSKIHFTVVSRTTNWWLSAVNPYGMLGGKRYIASQICINPTNTNQIFVAGRAGAWRSDNGGTDWYPCVRDIALTINYGVKADPNDKNYVYVANSDWVAVRSSDRLQSIVSEKPANSNNAFTFAFDTSTTPSRAYIAVADAHTANSGGAVLSRAPSNSKWINEQFELAGSSVGVVDNFARIVASGWGSADTGGAYTITGGMVTEYNVSVDSATIGPITSGSNRIAHLTATSLTDINGNIMFSWDTAPVGGNHEARVLVRANALVDTYYSFGVRHLVSGTLNLIMRKSVSGTVTTLQNVDIYESYTLGSRIVLQFSAVSSLIQCSAWLETDEPPEDWQLSQTDASIAGPDTVAVFCNRQVASTATPTFSFINFTVTTPAGGGANGAWPLGLAFGTDSGPNKVLIVAAQESGIWRKPVPTPGAGLWTQVSSSAMQSSQNTKQAPMAWVPGSAYVWLFDRASGVWRSNDYGVTWTQVWVITSNIDYTGYIAADPSDPSVVWVSRSTGLYKLTGADTGTSVGSGITATLVGAVSNPGAMCVSSGNEIYVATRALAGVPTSVLRSLDGGLNWTDISSDVLKNTMNFIHSMDIDSEGRIYLAANGTGVDYFVPRDPQTQQTL